MPTSDSFLRLLIPVPASASQTTLEHGALTFVQAINVHTNLFSYDSTKDALQAAAKPHWPQTFDIRLQDPIHPEESWYLG